MLAKRRVDKLITYVEERNSSGSITDFYGININKEFMPTVANIDGVDAKKYKIVRDNRFVFSGMQTGRDECIRIGLYRGESPIIVSPAYTTFEIANIDEVLPEYFFMLFLRHEMDRYGWFLSDSSVRANLDLDRFGEIEFQLPPEPIQRKYVNIFNAINRVSKLKAQMQRICPILIKSSLEEAKKS
jgi:type I restriction enzyme S subunit